MLISQGGGVGKGPTVTILPLLKGTCAYVSDENNSTLLVRWPVFQHLNSKVAFLAQTLTHSPPTTVSYKTNENMKKL